MHLICLQLRATKWEWKLVVKWSRCYDSPETQANGNTLKKVETFRYLGVVLTSGRRLKVEINTRVNKSNAVLCELHCSVVTKRDLSNTPQNVQFINPSFSDPHPWSLILGNDWKGATPSTSGREWIFAKCLRRDTLRKSAQFWNWSNPECPATSRTRRYQNNCQPGSC